jgi:hypothetical protein
MSQRLFLVVALLLATPVARAQGTDSFGDLNDTLVHYYLTSAYNVRYDLQRAKEFALRYDLPTSFVFISEAGPSDDEEEEQRSVDDRIGFFLTFRGDKLYEGGGDIDGGVDYLNVAYELQSVDDELSWDVHVGLAMIEYRRAGQEKGQMFINILGGFDMAIEDDVMFGADVSFNLITASGMNTAQTGDFDQLATYLDIPSLGAYGSFRYDLGSKVPRDVEVGKAFNLEKDRLGVLRFAYSQRFKYEITGLFVRNSFAAEGLPTQVLEADSSGVVRWERIGPVDFGTNLLFSGGVAVGNVPKLLRYAYGEVNLQFDGWGLYGRGGAAYGRVQEETVAGYSGGLELVFADGGVVARVGYGKRDVEVVDRVGSSDRAALNIFVSGGMPDISEN